MNLQDRGWYLLPDGTRVQARRSRIPPPCWLLVSTDGNTPLYGFFTFGSCQWEAVEGGYRMLFCDLTPDDLRPDHDRDMAQS
jgi:hypothetical protein